MTDDERPVSAKPAKRPSIKDVAAQAGVSWRTVSNVIHGHHYLRPETKAKVEAAIADLGYRPTIAARQLRSGKSNLLTLAVPFISHPYFSGLAHAVVEEAERLGYTVLIDETRGLQERESQVASGYRSLLADGIIFSPLTLDVRELSVQSDTPLVLLGEHTLATDVDHVTVDNAGSTREATEHLLAEGRRRIAFLGYLSQGTLGTADLRLQGYREALEAAGIEVTADRIIDAPQTEEPEEDRATGGAERDYSREEGYARALQLLERLPDIDAVVCANDLLAVGVLKAFRDNDVRVPQDIAVVGWDNTPDGEYAGPSLTTVAPDIGAIARYAVESLHRRIQDPTAPISSLVAPHKLIIRESSRGSVGTE